MTTNNAVFPQIDMEILQSEMERLRSELSEYEREGFDRELEESRNQVSEWLDRTIAFEQVRARHDMAANDAALPQIDVATLRSGMTEQKQKQKTDQELEEVCKRVNEWLERSITALEQVKAQMSPDERRAFESSLFYPIPQLGSSGK